MLCCAPDTLNCASLLGRCDDTDIPLTTLGKDVATGVFVVMMSGGAASELAWASGAAIQRSTKNGHEKEAACNKPLCCRGRGHGGALCEIAITARPPQDCEAQAWRRPRAMCNCETCAHTHAHTHAHARIHAPRLQGPSARPWDPTHAEGEASAEMHPLKDELGK
jgi:hypothetical protein